MPRIPIQIEELITALPQTVEVVILESQKIDHSASKKSYVAIKSRSSIKAYQDNIIVTKDGFQKTWTENPWIALKEFADDTSDWLFGFLGYDLKSFIEDVASSNKSLIEVPDLYFMNPEILIEITATGEGIFLKGTVSDLENLLEPTDTQPFGIHQQKSIDKKQFIEDVKRIKHRIYEGDVYEVNYSYAHQFECEGNSYELFQQMRERGEVPFAAYMQFEGINVCCSSPERFLKKEGRSLFSQPIKGTIPNNESHSLADLTSEKNRAENLMIVDLVRNDLNRVSEPGSVQVESLFEVQSFKTVHQLVSTITATSKNNVHPVDLIEACFPMGSMTGAPKIAAMEIIEEIEHYKRGLYSGAIGYFTPDQDFDLNVVIRTAIINKNTLVYPVGGAITADSDPEDEWHETLVKTEALKNTLEILD
ncbi:MAG: anthranilate synthase component I family protein [Balneolaceae bacterium]|nr:anthranilate synthase component I family protein [Balneolaceae bacterium]